MEVEAISIKDIHNWKGLFAIEKLTFLTMRDEKNYVSGLVTDGEDDFELKIAKSLLTNEIEPKKAYRLIGYVSSLLVADTNVSKGNVISRYHEETVVNVLMLEEVKK